MHLIILFDGTICESENNRLGPQMQIVNDIISNYTINAELRIAFGTPIIYNNFNYYPYSCSEDVVNADIKTINQWCFADSPALDSSNNISATMEFSMSKLYTPDTPAFAFIILLRSNGSLSGDDAMKEAIDFRQTCLDHINAAVIVIQVDQQTAVNPNLATTPELFFVYDRTNDIVAKVTNALMELSPYQMEEYGCKRSNSTNATPPPGSCS
ncbi:hypothetical protein FO519_008767 [Halicephalobus sp. NKZ332]|nr:hypothetical protein FO519_008767 [Halicephalobus sp. NKZ332]